MGSDSFKSIELSKELFGHPLVGFLTTGQDGKIIQVNPCLADWMGSASDDLTGLRFSDLLTVGGKIYFETHLWPLLRMQRYFDEVALELFCRDGKRMQILANAYEKRDDEGNTQFICFTVFKASDRRTYEQNLKEDKYHAEQKLLEEREIALVREQFIAVLGHDLRNPLSSIMTAASLLSEEDDIEPHQPMIAIIQRSASRMAELINNIMDFARARMGSGLVVDLKPTEIDMVLQHGIDEIAISWPDRVILSEIEIHEPVHCDAHRLAQLLSNLLANALTHGTPDKPVVVRASSKNGFFELSVINQGIPIPSSSIEKLFLPFTREGGRASRQGLGLGLFIASEIARVHHAELSVSSDEQETKFTFRMPLNL